MSDYTIEVDDDAVRISGNLTIREAFDFLSFYEREGFIQVAQSSYDETSLYLKKIDQEKEREKNRLEAEEARKIKEEKEKKEYFIDYKNEKDRADKLQDDVNSLKFIIKSSMEVENVEIKSLRKQVEELNRKLSLKKLKESEFVKKLPLKMDDGIIMQAEKK